MSSHIYHGVWINWSKGPIAGATLTLGERDGGLLTAFIATFVTIVGAQLWKVISYTSHQIRARSVPRDGLHHQQQVLFRNSASPMGAAWKFMQQAWYWRGEASHAFLRTAPWAIFATLYVGLFGALAVFSSEVSKAPGSSRLVIGDQCGFWDPDMSSSEHLNAFRHKMANDSLTAAAYARACYGGSYDPLRCEQYPSSSIKWTSDQNATCPFESGLCIYSDKAAFKMTSQKIDSHHDLGINTPEKERLQFQMETTCAPIHALGYATAINGSSETIGQDGDVLYAFWYGQNMWNATTNITDFTWIYNTHASIDQFGYIMKAYYAWADWDISGGGFVPVSALNRTDADLTLLFITPNSIRFQEPCDDPVFGAHKRREIESGVFYDSDTYVSVLACTEQYIVCNPNTDTCTPPLGHIQVEAATQKLGLNTIQSTLKERFLHVMSMSSIYYSTVTRGATALRAQDTVFELEQAPLPANQWMVEVSSWFDTGLARLQMLVQEYATGPSNIPVGSKVTPPADADLVGRAMCYSQLVNDSSNSMSFSIIGLIITFVVGTVIILIALSVDVIVGWIQERWKIGLYKKMSWAVDDTLQMQKLLYQDLGLGEWNVDTDSEPIPTTTKLKRTRTFVGLASVKAKGGQGHDSEVSSREGGVEYTSVAMNEKGEYPAETKA